MAKACDGRSAVPGLRTPVRAEHLDEGLKIVRVTSQQALLAEQTLQHVVELLHHGVTHHEQCLPREERGQLAHRALRQSIGVHVRQP